MVNKKWIIVIVAIVLLFLYLSSQSIDKFWSTEGDDEIKIKLSFYDKDGNQVYSIYKPQSLALVTPPGEQPFVAYSMKVSVSMQNLGNVELRNIMINSSETTPASFKTAALNNFSAINSLQVGAPPLAEQVIGPLLLDNLVAEAGSYGNTTLKITFNADHYSLDPRITTPQTKSFSKNIYIDIMPEIVNFRTSDLTYLSGTKVAISRICGQRLIGYSYGGTSYDHSCSDTDEDLIIPYINGTTKLWFGSPHDLYIHICLKQFNVVQKYQKLTTSQSESFLSLLPDIVSLSNEKACNIVTCPINKEALVVTYNSLAIYETPWLGEACFNVDLYRYNEYNSINWTKPYDIIIASELGSSGIAALGGPSKINNMPALLTYFCDGPDVYWSNCGQTSSSGVITIDKTIDHPISNEITFPYPVGPAGSTLHYITYPAPGVDSLAYKSGEPGSIAIAKLEHGAELKDGSTKYGRGVFISKDINDETIFKNAVNWITETKCGNGRIDNGEICDGLNLNGNDCTAIGQGFTGGKLACSFTCNSWDTLQCTEGTVVFRTNKYLTYGTSDVWIAVDCDKDGNLDKYGYSGSSSYGCVLEDIFETTYDGYNICTRPPYLCSDRVYVKYGLIYRYNYGAGVNAITTTTPCCDTTCGPCCEKYSDGISDC